MTIGGFIVLIHKFIADEVTVLIFYSLSRRTNPQSTKINFSLELPELFPNDPFKQCKKKLPMPEVFRQFVEELLIAAIKVVEEAEGSKW
jgi:hypothetical protein